MQLQLQLIKSPVCSSQEAFPALGCVSLRSALPRRAPLTDFLLRMTSFSLGCPSASRRYTWRAGGGGEGQRAQQDGKQVDNRGCVRLVAPGGQGIFALSVAHPDSAMKGCTQGARQCGRVRVPPGQ